MISFFLTLVKLRTNKTNFELSLWFNISGYTVLNTFIMCINFMYHQWKEIDVSPFRDLVRYFMPGDFKKKFPKTRFIIDGMSSCEAKVSICLAIYIFELQYRNTVKVLVGCATSGLAICLLRLWLVYE